MLSNKPIPVFTKIRIKLIIREIRFSHSKINIPVSRSALKPTSNSSFRGSIKTEHIKNFIQKHMSASSSFCPSMSGVQVNSPGSFMRKRCAMTWL